MYSLIPIDGDNRWAVHGVLAGIIISLIIGFIARYDLWLRTILVFGALLAGTILYWLVTFRLIYYRYIVVNQIENYPGHEKWIAFSIDAYNSLSDE